MINAVNVQSIFEVQSKVSAMTLTEPGRYVRVRELANGKKPMRSQRVFSTGRACRALGLYNPSETRDDYLVVSNEGNEIGLICNRHLRTHGLFPQESNLRIGIAERMMEAAQ